MPAIIAHDNFGQRILSEFGARELDLDACNAFLLGNQGPDPLFYGQIGLSTMPHSTLGSQMHRLDPARIIQEWNRAIWAAPLAHREILRAYAAGFVCHYLLDSYAHPLVFSQQHAYCNAGIEGLTERDGSDVHIFIERDIDEVVLFTNTGMTVAEYDPLKNGVLELSDWALSIISRNYATVVWHSMGVRIPDMHFAHCVKLFRFSQRVLYSPTGVWRERLSKIDGSFRRYSFCRNMMMRPVPAEHSPYMNEDHGEWIDSYTGERRNQSFYDLEETAHQEALKWLPELFGTQDLSIDTVREMTEGYCFSGQQKF